MRCATCGATVEPERVRCPECGSGTHSPADPPALIRRCPRCGYRGQGIRHFRSPGRIGLLVLLSLVTYGLGGFIYWLVKRNHFLCPNCGLDWEHARRGGAVQEGGVVPKASSNDSMMLPSGGMKRRVFGVAGLIVGAFLISLGMVESGLEVALTGSALAASGSVIFLWGWRARQERRDALMRGMQQRVLRLASRRSGTLTVTEVASRLDLSLEAAERVLISMDDGFRVRSEITRDGVILYEFPEILHRLEQRPADEP